MSQSTTSLFRRLAWQSSVTLEIRFAEDGPGGGGVPEVYYVSRVASDSEQGTVSARSREQGKRAGEGMLMIDASPTTYLLTTLNTRNKGKHGRTSTGRLDIIRSR
jgi:hypothetical protein